MGVLCLLTWCVLTTSLGCCEINYVTRQINFLNVRTILILYTTWDERPWEIFIVIPSGIHRRHHFFFFFVILFLFYSSICVHQSQVSYAFLALFLGISLQDMFVPWLRSEIATHHVTKHNTPIHNILSTVPHLSIFQKALGMLPEDGNVIPKHVGATIYN
jgi:hypothetical protein